MEKQYIFFSSGNSKIILKKAPWTSLIAIFVGSTKTFCSKMNSRCIALRNELFETCQLPCKNRTSLGSVDQSLFFYWSPNIKLPNLAHYQSIITLMSRKSNSRAPAVLSVWIIWTPICTKTKLAGMPHFRNGFRISGFESNAGHSLKKNKNSFANRLAWAVNWLSYSTKLRPECL